MNYAIILAGGAGSRFWPLSRQFEPKQFLGVCSRKPLITETLRRIAPVIGRENILIATNRMYSQRVRMCLRKFNIPLKNFFFEPQGKNTLAPVAVISKLISLGDQDAVVAVLPSDHFVKDVRGFTRLLRQGLSLARGGQIVTFGVSPSHPQTGYGYLRVNTNTPPGSKYYKVDSFIEKPPLAQAKDYCQDKRYFWNSGIFIFRPSTLLEEIRRFLPRMHKVITGLRSKRDALRRWNALTAISIDYGIMEKTARAVLLPVDCGWTDIGSWQALDELTPKNKEGNIFKGRCLDRDSKNIFVWSDSRLVATVGLRDIIVVDTADALLVCAKDKAQEVKNIVQILKRKNQQKHL